MFSSTKNVVDKREPQFIKRSLKGLRVAVQYPCKHESELYLPLIKERMLDKLVEATGAESVDYPQKMGCCGGLMGGIYDKDARKLVRTKFNNMRRASVDCILTACPACFHRFETFQMDLRKKYELRIKTTISKIGKGVFAHCARDYSIPVLYWHELLGLAMGFNYEELRLQTHQIRVEPTLEKLGFSFPWKTLKENDYFLEVLTESGCA